MTAFLVMLATFILSYSAPAQAEPEPGAASESISPAEPKPLPPYPPTAHYQVKTVEGWPVLVNRDFLRASPKLAERTLNLLQRQLEQVARRVPAQSLKTLRTIRIWVEEREPNTPCMAYHPNADWLREHGVNPDKARCVELANAKNFLAWTVDQPWIVLHELAHGFHHQHLDQGFQNRPLQAQFDRARAEGLYDSVLRINGKREKAYAITNPMEYFAESTEAYFGTNDFYPYVRSELKEHDPRMFNLLGTIWETGSGS